MKILLVTTSRWASSARLAMAMTDIGCEVTALCPHSHPMLQTSVIRKHLLFQPLRPLHCIAKAIRETTPDFIVPGDELAVFTCITSTPRRRQMCVLSLSALLATRRPIR